MVILCNRRIRNNILIDIVFSMDIIDLKPKQHPQSFINTIISALQLFQFYPLHPPAGRSPNMYFFGILMLPRVKKHLSSTFGVKMAKDKLLKVELFLNPEICDFSAWLLQFFQKRFTQICHFIHISNHLRLNEKEGVVKLSESTGNLSFRTTIFTVFMVSSGAKQTSVLISHIKRMINNFSQTLENIIFYYRIPGCNLNELQLILQENNAIPLKSIVEKIMLLKNYFDEKAIKSSTYSHQIIKEADLFLRGDSFGNNLFQARVKNQFFRNIQSEFRVEQKMIGKNLLEFQNFKFDSILTAIKIKRKTMEQPIAQGGFSYITYGFYNFIPLFSVYESVSNALSMTSISQEKTDCCLVKKVSPSQRMTGSMKNQCDFLTYMRAKVCPYFAKYYCNKSLAPFADGQIYLQYYPQSLDETRLREEGKLKILQDVCMGLYFLSREQILHRDLKQLNIMVDRSKRGRIIDFGSVATFSKSQRLKIHDCRLRSTEGYYYSYRDVCQHYPFIATLYTIDEYYRHPNFDIYSLGRIIHNQFSLELIFQEGDFLRNFLHYLSMRCMQVNPEDRWSINKVLYFLRQLLFYLEQQRKFWKYSFDQKCKAQILGSTFIPLEYSNQERNGLN